jgi:hypothetical protein
MLSMPTHSFEEKAMSILQKLMLTMPRHSFEEKAIAILQKPNVFPYSRIGFCEIIPIYRCKILPILKE